MTNKQNADASESFRQLMAAYSKAFSSTPDSVKEEENATTPRQPPKTGQLRVLEPPPYWTPTTKPPKRPSNSTSNEQNS